jgi:hypothetical protein
VFSELLAPHSILALLLELQHLCDAGLSSSAGAETSSMRSEKGAKQHKLAPKLLQQLHPNGGCPSAEAAVLLHTTGMAGQLAAAVAACLEGGDAVSDDDSISLVSWASGGSAYGEDAALYAPPHELLAYLKRWPVDGGGNSSSGTAGSSSASELLPAWVQKVPAALQATATALATAAAAQDQQQQPGGSSSSDLKQAATLQQCSGPDMEVLQLLQLLHSGAAAAAAAAAPADGDNDDNADAAGADDLDRLAAAESVLQVLQHSRHGVLLLVALYGFLSADHTAMSQFRAAVCGSLSIRWLRMLEAQLQALQQQQQQQQLTKEQQQAYIVAAEVCSQLLGRLQEGSALPHGAISINAPDWTTQPGVGAWLALQQAGAAASKQLADEVAAEGGLPAKLLFSHAAVSLPWPLWLPSEADALFDCFDRRLCIKCWLPPAAAVLEGAPAAAAAVSAIAQNALEPAAAAAAQAVSSSTQPTAEAAAAAAGVTPSTKAAMSTAWGTLKAAEDACQDLLQQWQHWLPQPWRAALDSNGNQTTCQNVQQLAAWVKTAWYSKMFSNCLEAGPA